MKPRDREKTAFSSPHALFQFTKMLFGLRNTPTKIRRATDVIPFPVKWKSGLVHWKVIVVFLKTAKNYMSHLRQIITLLRDSGVALKLKRCLCLAEKIDHLGHVICIGRLKISSTTIFGHQGIEGPYQSNGTPVVCRVMKRILSLRTKRQPRRLTNQ